MSFRPVGRAVAKVQHYYAGVGLRGVFLFVWAKVSGKRPLCRVRIPGVRLPVTVRIGTTDVSVLRQVLRERQYDAPLPEMPIRIVDAGANIGLASVFFANKYPQAQIVCLEPEESNFNLLKANVRDYPNIHPIQGALSSTDGRLMLIDAGTGHHGFRTMDVDENAVNSRSLVPAFTIPSLMKRMNWRGVDLLKIDIEGAEKEVFEASDSWIGSVRACMVELHETIKPGSVGAFERATEGFVGRVFRGESLIVWRPAQIQTLPGAVETGLQPLLHYSSGV